MIDFIKIAKFLAANLLGFYITPFVFTVAVKFGFFPSLPEGGDLHSFEFLLGGGMWFWVAGGLLSIGYFFAEGKKASRWFVFAPLYFPFIYDVVILGYLNLS